MDTGRLYGFLRSKQTLKENKASFSGKLNVGRRGALGDSHFCHRSEELLNRRV
jgi:hypothetical protein